MSSMFNTLGLLPELVQAVEAMGFEQPSPVQQAAIPPLLEGRSVVAQAQTGTGKTAAFALPMLQRLQPGVDAVQALIMAPTRELAVQDAEATRRMAGKTRARILTVYGGAPYAPQIRALERGVDVVVGTPGRLLDLIRRGVLNLTQVSMLVLDEADEMLEMGFIEDVETILAQMPAERQTALFSATLPDAIRKLASRYVVDAVEVKINPQQLTVAETEQRCCFIREDQKLDALTRLLEVEDVKSALVFTRTKVRSQEIADTLNRQGIPAEALHGDLNQSRRESVLGRFRSGAVRLLVATDVAARGLDIDDVTHVINFDVPADVEDYVHRIGRTGRAGREGIAITFLTPRERSKARQIEAYTRQSIEEIRVPTRTDLLARRDERFMAQITELLGKGSIDHERAVISSLAETSFDLMDIAAAAIKLARAGEAPLPAEDILPVEKRRPRAEERHANPVADRSTRPIRRDRRGNAAKSFSREQRPTETGMVRLWMNLGNAQGIKPGDIVGAIAGETGIPGRAIGEIDIHRDHTFVDVAEKHVGKVLRASSGRYSLRGKPVLLKRADH